MYRIWSASLLVLVAAATVEGKFFSATIARERLITDLFVNYDAGARPAPKGQLLALTVNIELQHFDYRESDGAFNFVGLIDVVGYHYKSWRDPKLAWNPADYNNLTKIPVSQKVVWVPDLEIYNNAPDKFVRMHRNGNVVLSHNGDVMWTDAIVATIFCTADMHSWPRDRHTCKLTLGSWTYDGLELDIVNTDANNSMRFDAGLHSESTEYRIINYTAKHVATVYECCTEPYITIDYHLTFERRSSFLVIFRTPAMCIVMLTLLALSMEPWRGEKILLNGISIFIIILNLLYFATRIGGFARTTPMIVVFYSCSLVIVTLCHLLSVFSLLATRSHFKGRLPPCVTRFLNDSLVHFSPEDQRTTDQHHPEQQSPFEDVKLEESSNLISADRVPNEWNQLATFLERVAMWFFGLIFLIMGTICFL